MAETVKLDENVMHGVKVKVCGGKVGLQVVGRVLNRGELIDFIFLGHNDHAAGMLTGGALDACASDGQTVFFRVAALNAALLHVPGDIAEGCLVGERGDGACTEHMVMTKELFDIMVSLVLVFTGEVQVDIRHFVAFKPEEDLERNIKAVLDQRTSADGTVAVRQVHADVIFALVDIKEAVVAVDAAVVGRECVHLRNAAHACHKGGTDGTTGTDQIAVFKGLGDQLFRDIVERTVAVSDNGLELFFQTLEHNLGQRIAVKLLGGIPCHVLDVVCSILPHGLEGILILGMLREEPERFHHVCNFVRVVNDDLVAFLGPKIAEFLQHLIGRLEVERRLIVAVFKPHAGLNNGTVDGVVRIHEMDVAGGDNRDAQFFAQAHDLPVQVPERILIGHLPLADEKGIVADGLDFEVIIEGGHFLELVPGILAKHSAEQLSGFTGTAQNQPLTVLLNHAAGHVRAAAEIVQV